MKPAIKIFISTLMVVLLVTGCRKEGPKPIVEPLNDQSLPSAALLKVQVLDQNNTQLRLRLDMAVFRDSKNLEDNLDAASFKIDSVVIQGDDFGFSNTLTRLVSGASGANYAALMLLDQSGSIYSTDPEDYRLEASKIFCLNLGTGNTTALWEFSGSAYTNLVDFTTDTAKVIQEIENLRGEEGGGTPLYNSQYEAISYTKSHSDKGRKAVLSFTDGQSSTSGKTAEEVIQHALDQQVILYNIGLGDVNTEHLQQQATASHGAFMYAKDARQLISIFGNLGKLLDNTAMYYQTEWTLSSKDAQASFPGSGTFLHEVQITFPFGGQITVPFKCTFDIN